ncbi:glucosamine-6-phosphate deaminase [Levilactobacillus bambusae]|uniref:Glucosamine-6-phosphate deaminase n=1 Tax=Levilactobacillus bambusae TaxID=2024736 RepID=A0A2V1MZV6_9LACO|nr:glucosamine-6-phosphate deaminase [Levilactobacillus bambusae]PWF99629.1 glucosamine-6-phosphate deaminase [Levilactobacillus bambusae]
MNIVVVKDNVEGGQKGYEIFKQAVDNGAKVFGLATGSTPITTYDQITASDLDFSDKTSINLDEYVGLGPDAPQSYHYFMNEHFFSKKPFAQSYVPDGLNLDAMNETERYDKIIADNPIDLQILGLGRNGHIGFNEPGTDPESTTHKVKLTESTIEANARFFDNEEDVPRYAYSMGIASIMKSKHILLEAYGAEKADAIQRMVQGPITTDVPASFLQNHPDVTIIVDEAAASKLK